MTNRPCSARLEPYLTARDLAHLHRVPVGTVYRWASEDRWPRTRTRPRRYSVAACEQSATRRHQHNATP